MEVTELEETQVLIFVLHFVAIKLQYQMVGKLDWIYIETAQYLLASIAVVIAVNDQVDY